MTTLPDGTEWNGPTVTLEELRESAHAERAGQILAAHQVIDVRFDAAEETMEHDLRRAFTANGINDIAEREIQGLLGAMRVQALRARMQAHRDLWTLADAVEQEAEVQLALIERALDGAGMQ